jgi:hypothetical protein
VPGNQLTYAKKDDSSSRGKNQNVEISVTYDSTKPISKAFFGFQRVLGNRHFSLSQDFQK